MSQTPVPAEQLRWRCPATCLDFTTTDDLLPAEGVVGQDDAVEALRFGLRIEGHGQNVFVRGPAGSGRLSLVRDLVRTVEPSAPEGRDHCYVHHFSRPDQPLLLTLAPGSAPALRVRVEELVRFVLEDLSDLVSTDSLRLRTHDLQMSAQREADEVADPFQKQLRDAGLILVGVESEDGTTPAIVPVVNGEPTGFDELEEQIAEGRLEQERVDRWRADADKLQVQLDRVSATVVRVRKRAQRAVRRLQEQEARRVLRDVVADIRRTWPATGPWLDELVEDAARQYPAFEEHPELVERYRVNVHVTRNPGAPRPVVVENIPTVQNLLGSIDPPTDELTASHLGIHCGSLLRADGGTLVLLARDVLTEPGAWRALTRTLRTGQIELSPHDGADTTVRAPGVKPDPIPVRTKVVLIGEEDVWFALEEADPDFDELFKVLVDFDDTMTRDAAAVAMYGRVVSRIARDEGLPAFTSSAVGAVVEFGAREAAEPGKLSARFGRIADVVREAAFATRARGGTWVDRDDVDRALAAARRRADLPGRRFRERLANGRVLVRTHDWMVGEVNGLAVVSTGLLDHGFPTRITATVGPGREGTIHVEHEAMLSGQIHTKGFLIVRGLMRHLLRTQHALTFDASVTHEQSYGGIDGDSASAAEFCSVLSALTNLPVKQGVAVTGAIDQHGHVLPVGAVNEKIEGFFDACATAGLDGQQGVVIPRQNVGDLQLRRDVVAACRAGRFAVWGVDTIHQVVELLMDRPAGAQQADGTYPDGTVLRQAVDRAEHLWQASLRPGSSEP
ncbi:MAG: AAA family ATPase [Alphaproteobacteria bacterium]|nr:AAA family ATPase [Alphaproteobacteria bacterium]MCB9697394.1 AAA family ATPase [Alphaproteobacteria bacterium]